MTKEEAIQVVGEVCASAQTNLAGHQKIQTAMNVIKGILFPPDPKEKAADPAEKK
jgi:hypothetical protein